MFKLYVNRICSERHSISFGLYPKRIQLTSLFVFAGGNVTMCSERFALGLLTVRLDTDAADG